MPVRRKRAALGLRIVREPSCKTLVIRRSAAGGAQHLHSLVVDDGQISAPLPALLSAAAPALPRTGQEKAPVFKLQPTLTTAMASSACEIQEIINTLGSYFNPICEALRALLQCHINTGLL